MLAAMIRMQPLPAPPALPAFPAPPLAFAAPRAPPAAAGIFAPVAAATAKISKTAMCQQSPKPPPAVAA
eukprot:724981-Lingulodinium_polyedra.AAC.1